MMCLSTTKISGTVWKMLGKFSKDCRKVVANGNQINEICSRRGYVTVEGYCQLRDLKDIAAAQVLKGKIPSMVREGKKSDWVP